MQMQYILDMDFLAEDADFAERCEASGFIFIGPSSEMIIRQMGDKITAKGSG